MRPRHRGVGGDAVRGSTRLLEAKRPRALLAAAGSHAVLIVACLIVVAPCYFLVLGSFKSVEEFFAAPFGLPHHVGFSNYRQAWTQGSISRTLRNSVIVTGASVTISTVFSCLASYAIARLPFRGSTFWRLVFVGGLIVPVQLIMIAIFIIMRWLGLLGSLFSLIVVYSTFGIPLGVLVLVGFFRALPRELSEAAVIDGAGHFQTFRLIVLPLARAPIFTVIILNGVWMWNDFFLGFILINHEKSMTLPVGIMAFRGTYSTEWGLIFASVTISILPVVAAYLLLSRQFIAGLTAGSVKG
jgi:raffinose/stachyose/melibiose transport system permease protein